MSKITAESAGPPGWHVLRPDDHCEKAFTSPPEATRACPPRFSHVAVTSFQVTVIGAISRLS
jgi:hypothetical protein